MIILRRTLDCNSQKCRTFKIPRPTSNWCWSRTATGSLLNQVGIERWCVKRPFHDASGIRSIGANKLLKCILHDETRREPQGLNGANRAEIGCVDTQLDFVIHRRKISLSRKKAKTSASITYNCDRLLSINCISIKKQKSMRLSGRIIKET